MPILGRIKVTAPKTVVKNDTFSPAAIIPELISPIDSIASNAVIMPIIDPKKPITKPRMLASDAKPVIFFDLNTFFLRFTKPITTKDKASKRHIKIRDINNGPPSINLSTKGFNAITDNKFIINGFN